jgi:hypothetical protein
MRRKIIALIRLVGLASSVLSFAAGCDPDDHGCPADEPCVDVGVLLGSAISVSVRPDDDGNDEVSVHATLPAAFGGLCYNVPDDLVATANGEPAVQLAVGHDSGHTVSFSSMCPSEQYAGAKFVVSAGSSPVTITFTRGDSTARLTVDRVARPPVDVTLSATAVSRGTGLSAEVVPLEGTLPTADGCWSAHLLKTPTYAATVATTAAPAETGVHVDIAFEPGSPAANLPPGPVQLFLSARLGDGCDAATPAVSCARFRSCTVEQSARSYGPYPLELL